MGEKGVFIIIIFFFNLSINLFIYFALYNIICKVSRIGAEVVAQFYFLTFTNCRLV